MAAVTVGLVAAISIAVPASAAAMEYDLATAGSTSSAGVCASWIDPNPGPTTGCFVSDGDIFKVSDLKSDGHSAAVYWQNFNTSGAVYRQGACVDTQGAWTAGICNKNFAENSRLRIKACTMDWSTKSQYACGPWQETNA